jgi:hypothetical protein
MQTTTVAAELTVARAPHEVFALFGTVEGAGWVFGARCDEVRAGAPVSLRLPSTSRAATTSTSSAGSPASSPPPSSTSSTPSPGAAA